MQLCGSYMKSAAFPSTVLTLALSPTAPGDIVLKKTNEKLEKNLRQRTC